MTRRRQPEPADLITIAEASKLLDVSLPTMRRWDESAKFLAHWHPNNSYRMYLRDDVLKLRKRVVEGKKPA